GFQSGLRAAERAIRPPVQEAGNIMTQATTNDDLWLEPGGNLGRERPNWTDLVFLLLLTAGAVYAFKRGGSLMDVYDRAILVATVPVMAWLGWLWRPLRRLMIALMCSAGLALMLYDGNLARADEAFLLRYLLSSQSAIMWMCALFSLATVCYWVGLGARSATAGWLGTAFTWSAVLAGISGLLVRWHESHLIGAGIGYIPVSNLYEVVVLFALVTALFYLYYEQVYSARSLGAFVLLIISAAIAFLLWYSFERNAHQIQPLVPALK